MADTPPNQRKRKRLLVASVGVATVSFLALQTGCEEEAKMTNVANLLAPPDFSNAETRDAALDATADALPTSGNLLPMPPMDAASKDASGDALTTSGNLIPPPADAALDAAGDAAKDADPNDAKGDAWLPPSSGNLIPVPPAGDR